MNKPQSQPKKIVHGGRSVPRNGYLGTVILADKDIDGPAAAALLQVINPEWADVPIVFVDGPNYNPAEDPDHAQDILSGSVALDMIVPGLLSLKMSGLTGVFPEKNTTVEVAERGSAAGAVMEEFATKPWQMNAFGLFVTMLDGADGYGRPWYKFEREVGVEFGSALSDRLGRFSLVGVLYACRRGNYLFNQERARHPQRNTNKVTSDLVRWWLMGYRACWHGDAQTGYFNWPRILENHLDWYGESEGFLDLLGFVQRMGRDGRNNPIASYLKEAGFRFPEEILRDMGRLTWTNFFEFVKVGIECENFEAGLERDVDAMFEDIFACFLRGHVSIDHERQRCREELIAAYRRPGSNPNITVSPDQKSVLLRDLQGAYQDVAFELGSLVVVSVREGHATVTRSKWSDHLRVDSEELVAYMKGLVDRLGGTKFYKESWFMLAEGCQNLVGSDPGIMLAKARRAVGLDDF